MAAIDSGSRTARVASAPHRWRALVGLALALFALSSPLLAQQSLQQSREREALRRAQLATQKAEQEKTQLQEQNAKLEKDKQDLSAKLKTAQKLKGELAAAKAKGIEQTQEIDQLRSDLRIDSARIGDMEAKLKSLNAQIAEDQEQSRQLAGQIKTLEAQLQQQREIIAHQSQALHEVNGKNMKLYQLNAELIDRYNKKGVWDSLMQREPVTQIKDVRIQSMLQEYRDRNDELKNEKPQLTQ